VNDISKGALKLAALGEMATGAALLIVPSLVGRLLLGEALDVVAARVAAVAGIALIGLGVACWPGTPRSGMLTYSVGVTLYLGFLGLTGDASGVLLWPGVLLHLLLAFGLVASRRVAGG